MNINDILAFLKDLSANNSKEWMDKEKSRYLAVRDFWMDQVAEMLDRLSIYDERLHGIQPKDTVHRIYNNRRFQPDKPVYKDNFTFTPYLKIAPASFHLSISPGRSFVGGGLYRPPADLLANVRRFVAQNGKELQEIVTENRFVNFYGGLDSSEETLRTAPKGFPKDHEYIEFLKMKSFISLKTLSTNEVTAGGLIELVEESYLAIKPLIDYLNEALSDEGINRTV